MGHFSLRGVWGTRSRQWMAIGVMLLSGTVYAQSVDAEGDIPEHAEPMWSLSGYGTVGLAHSTEHKADFVAHDLQRRGAGRHANWSAEVDSRVGAQLDGRFSSALSGVVQVTSEQRYDGSYKPEIEWANLKYQFTPDVSLRAGRIVLPTFLLSDSRKVGYSSPWVRPPVEVYSLVPMTRLDGVDGTWRHSFGDFHNTMQVAYGKSTARMPDDEGGKVEVENGMGISNTLEYGASTLHFTYIRARGSISSYDPLFNGYRQVAAMAPPLAPYVNHVIDKYEADDKPFSIFTIGASYNPGKWFVMGEYGIIDTHSVYGRRSGWYVSGGYRFGTVTPYVTYAAAHRNSNSSDPGIPNPGNNPLIAGLNAELNEQLSAASVQKTISLGVRWDCAKNLALKMQYDRTNIGSGSPGSLDHQSDDYVEGGKFRVFSITADFLF